MCSKIVLPIPRLCIVRTRFWDAAEERLSLLSEEVARPPEAP